MRSIDKEHSLVPRPPPLSTVPHAGFGLGVERTPPARHRPRKGVRDAIRFRARQGMRGIEACHPKRHSESAPCGLMAKQFGIAHGLYRDRISFVGLQHENKKLIRLINEK